MDLTRLTPWPRLLHLAVCLLSRVVVALLTAFAAAAFATEPKVEVIKHYNQGYSPLLRVYLTDVLKLTLDKTTAEYGPYDLQFFSQFLSANRSKLETEKGALLDVLFSSHWRGQFVNTQNVIPVEFPVLNGMLGLRSLIVTQENAKALQQTVKSADVKRLVAGLGANWVDVEILAANNIAVVEAQKFDALFPMLTRQRFDYIPLSMLEAQTALVEYQLTYANLAVSKDIGLFYPMPFYLYINAQRPRLAERLEKGLQIALQDGSIEALFNKHFYYVAGELQHTTKRLVVLNNPLISREKNRHYLQQFLDKYQNNFLLMPQVEVDSASIPESAGS